MIEDNSQKNAFLEETLREVLTRLGVAYSLNTQEGGEGIWFFIHTDDAPLLIGEAGQNLAALNFLMKRIAEKKYGQDQAPKFLVDINDYNKKKIEEIKDTARMHAQRVRYFKKEIELKPMNAYERRIVHSVLQEYPDITTESKGDGLARRVVIKPFNLIS